MAFADDVTSVLFDNGAACIAGPRKYVEAIVRTRRPADGIPDLLRRTGVVAYTGEPPLAAQPVGVSEHEVGSGAELALQLRVAERCELEHELLAVEEPGTNCVDDSLTVAIEDHWLLGRRGMHDRDGAVDLEERYRRRVRDRGRSA